MSEIFLSYRRADTGSATGRLADRLVERFGAAQVFRDLDSLEAGADFERVIRDTIRGCAAVVIVIGRRWLDARNEDGSRRLDDPLDYVRREIETALEFEVPVIPVLVEGAQVPRPESLPEQVRPLATRNAFELSDRRWEYDTTELLRHLETRIGVAPAPSPDEGSGGGTSATAVIGASLLTAAKGFVTDALLLVTRPRRFLARRSRGHPADVRAAFLFLCIAVVLSVLILLMSYEPRASAPSFIFTGTVVALFVTLCASGPLWLAWRLVGAIRHYGQLVTILFYQAAVIHLSLFVAMGVFVTGISLRNPARIAALMEGVPDAGLEGLNSVGNQIAAALDAPEAMLAFVASNLIVAAALIWLFASWGAYRDAFGVGRVRAVVALVLALTLAYAPLRALAWMAG